MGIIRNGKINLVYNQCKDRYLSFCDGGVNIFFCEVAVSAGKKRHVHVTHPLFPRPWCWW